MNVTAVRAPEPALAERAQRWARWWHLATFLVAALGLALQLWLAATQPIIPGRFGLPMRLWNVLSFYTIWSNILVAVVTFLLAQNPRRRGSWFAALRLASTTMITVTGLIYAFVLASLWAPQGWHKVADQSLHYIVPILAVLGFVLFGPRPLFDRHTLWRALLIPGVWVVYTLGRGPFVTYTEDGEVRRFYPYHFIDVDQWGYGRVLLNLTGVFLLLLLLSWLYLLADRALRAAPRG